ncbi:ribosome maturation factor RimM [Lacticaseibacillus pabuli]|uniref:Ribosome maturation factor RimM n=1 Tax=Lacticaseibacillus pabuli TaxID=3025672 RepID=A0ABY7WU71_9LACO|nr:ribosome maturation factor RimM [Lacticaseibacillus sp. KACC 23028]WDF83700.1 ribosome maturation factor RimM [Lacticaseibacillus sp. KACC 23028]
MPEFYHVGKIVNTHGIKGEVKVVATTDFPETRFKKGAKLVILGKTTTPVTITSSRVHKGTVLMTFDGYQDINEVLPFKGQLLGVREADLDQTDLEDNEYFYKDIIGLNVQDADGNEIGTVSEILSPGANDVWVVKRRGKQDLLLPYIESVVLRVDVSNKLTVVDIPEGLDPDEN